MTSPEPRSPPTADPAEAYRRRIAENEAEAAACDRRAVRLAAARLVAFGLLVLLVVQAFASGWSWALAGAGVAVFAALVGLHQRTLLQGWRARRRAALGERGLARIEDRWAGEGPEGTTWRPEGHLYADDLDLFGKGSLFQLLASVRTRAGEQELARWLLAPAPPDEIRARQRAVHELRGEVDLRERVALLGGDVASALDGDTAAAWAARPRRLDGRWVPWGARVIGLGAAVAVVGWIGFGWGLLPLAVLLLAQGLWTVRWWGPAAEVLSAADRPTRDLVLLGRVLDELERLGPASPWLKDLALSAARDGRSASARIHQLARLMDYVEARSNDLFLPLSWLLGLGTQLAFSIERWRGENGDDLVAWVRTAGAFEAMLALSAYAWEHPADAFPEVVEGDALFEGRALRHPLLPAARSIPNDVGLATDEHGLPQGFVVSGSNMSGKSTLLRTVGVNAVLAQAGAPVRASTLRLSPLVLGASIRVHDSLQGGESRFYAEIARLSRIVDRLTAATPVLFLLDEILHGTNSHDRRIGAAAVLRTLLEGRAIGLVTTHDLALAEIAESDRRLENVHFEDQLVDGRMLFDYRLRPGVVTHSNAIALMRAVGLDVDTDEEAGSA